MSRPISKAKVRLTVSVDSSSSSISFVPIDSTRNLTSVVMSDFGTYGFLTVNPTGTAENYGIVRFTSWSVSDGTITIGGLTWMALQNNDSSVTPPPFAAGTLAIISNNHNWLNHVMRDEDAQTIAGIKTFSASPLVPTGGSGTQAANATDIANAITGFTGTATASINGTTKLSTDPTTPGSPVALNSEEVSATSGNNKVVRSNSSGKIDAGFGGSASTIATLNSSSKVIEDPANLSATAVSGKIPQYNAALSIAVATTPTNSTDAASKAYVDTSVIPATVPAFFSITTALTYSGSTLQQLTSDPTGANLYLAQQTGSSPNGVITVYRYQLDTTTGNYYYAGVTASITETGSQFKFRNSFGIVAGSSFVWLCVTNTGGTDIAIYRFAKDLTGQTTMTISGTANSNNTGFSAGNDSTLYVSGETTVTATAVYTISGTTATRGTDMTGITTQAQNRTGFWFDGTYLIVVDKNNNNVITRWSTAGVSQASEDRRVVTNSIGVIPARTGVIYVAGFFTGELRGFALTKP